MKALCLLLILFLVPYRIVSGTSPNAVHTWLKSLFWLIHFDEISITIHFIAPIDYIAIFILIAFPALYFVVVLQIRSDNSYPKGPIVFSMLTPLALSLYISMEDEIPFSLSFSEYEWLILYMFSLLLLVTMVLIPLFVTRLADNRMQRDSRFPRIKIESLIVAMSVIILPSVYVGVGRMSPHYTYNETILYSLLWSVFFWERSGAFYGINEFVFEFHRLPSLTIALLSSFFNLAFVFALFLNYGVLNKRKRTLFLGIIGMIIGTLSYYFIQSQSSAIQRVYIFAIPIPITFILGLLILKFSYPRYDISITSYQEKTALDLESDEVLEISLVYRFISWLRKRI
jgi:hypothetical protein